MISADTTRREYDGRGGRKSLEERGGDKPSVQAGTRLCRGPEVSEFRGVGIGVTPHIQETKKVEEGGRERRGTDEAGVVGRWRTSRVNTVQWDGEDAVEVATNKERG